MTSSRYTDPPFRITRFSHLVLSVSDIEASARFYATIHGLVVTRRDAEAIHMRAIEETSHHSLILRRLTEGAASCDWLGLRLLDDQDLDRAQEFFTAQAILTEWAEVAGQGRTLRARLASGLPLEFTARMERHRRLVTDYAAKQGAPALRLDHCQVVVPNVAAAGAELLELGFNLAEAIESPDGQRIGMFLHRKNNPHDIVLATGQGPRLHHFAYIVPDLQAMFRACDLAGQLGLGHEVERGPGRHGPGNSAFVYFRDPDGHRAEMILPPMQIMDPDEPPRIWTAEEKHMIVPWGPPAPQRWREEATLFTGVPLSADGDLARWVSR